MTSFLYISDTPPLTTEEQAVLVAINPENELLYRNNKAIRVETPDLLDDPELNNNVDPMVGARSYRFPFSFHSFFVVRQFLIHYTVH